ncbi:MAG TPA: gluconate 2-dehydrogenase subunit 3 family protein [Gemmatimonadales bacterium]
MHRRDLLHLLGSFALVPALAPFSAERRLEIAEALHRRVGLAGLRILTPAQDAAVTAVAEAIIPRTDTPGATDAKVNEFIDLLLADYYTDEERARLLRGIDAIDAEAKAFGSTTFAAATRERQQTLLERWDNAESGPETATAAFKRLKNLTIYGFFTSRIAVEQVTKPVIFHPAFEGCVPFPAGGAR